MSRFAWVLFGILASAAMARGALYEIPLPELKGVYSTGDVAPKSKFLNIDLPVAFDHIDAIYLDITGNVAPSLWRMFDVNADSAQPRYEKQYPRLMFGLGGNWDPQSGLHMQGSGVLRVEPDGPFQMQGRFVDLFGVLGPSDPPNWLWLLHQNHTAIDLEIKYDFWSFGGEQVIPAIAAIIDARLIIEGTAVPEPTAGLLVLPGLLVLARRPRR